MYLVLHAQGDFAHGRWVGLSYDGPVVSGYATLPAPRTMPRPL